jgi:hypothetical protein
MECDAFTGGSDDGWVVPCPLYNTKDACVQCVLRRDSPIVNLVTLSYLKPCPVPFLDRAHRRHCAANQQVHALGADTSVCGRGLQQIRYNRAALLR